MIDMNVILLLVFIYHMVLVTLLIFWSDLRWTIKLVMPIIGIAIALVINYVMLSNRGIPTRRALPEEFWVLNGVAIEPNPNRGIRGGIFYTVRLDGDIEPKLFALPYTKENQKQQIKIDSEQKKQNGAPVRVTKKKDAAGKSGQAQGRPKSSMIESLEQMLNDESDEASELNIQRVPAGPPKD